MPKLNREEITDTTSRMPDNQALKGLAELGRELSFELGVQEELQKAIAESQAKTQRLQEVTIPDLMVNLGLEEIKLPSGEKIALQPVFGASVPDERKPKAWAWLRDNGHGAIIKSKVTLEFGMGEDEKLKIAQDILSEANLQFVAKEDVHASTLKSFVKDQYENGLTFPEALFGAFTKTIAKIKTK